MDLAKVEELMEELGIDQTKVAAVIELLGGDIKVEAPEADEESFYLPKVPKNFYYNPEVFRKLVTPDLSRLAKLVTPNLRRLRP